MDASIQYKESSSSGLDQLRIGDVTQIDRVRYSAEIKGPEGLEALRRARNALSGHDPLTISGHRAQNIRSQPRFKQYTDQIKDLFSRRPIFYYEPVELFRYRRPQQLVTYSFKGDIGEIKDFYSKIRSADHKEAIRKLPTFIRPFMEAQFDSLIASKDNLPNHQNSIQTSDHVHEAWRENKVNQGYPNFISQIINEAENTPDNAVIPPAPPIMKSSGKDSITRTVGFNDLAWELCKSSFEDSSAGTTTAYLHFYLDKGIFSRASDNDQLVLNAIRNQLSKRPYAGLAVTISNYTEIWNAGYNQALERFVTELEVICNERSLPLVAPRSGYYGMYLTDYGVDIFSSLMNGNLELNRKGGAPGGIPEYGTVPIYDACRDVTVDDLRNVLVNRQGQLYSVQGIPDSPQIFNPNANSLENRWGPPKQFRVGFGKQRRLLHLKEAEELQGAIANGTAHPATRYLETSEHPDLS